MKAGRCKLHLYNACIRCPIAYLYCGIYAC